MKYCVILLIYKIVCTLIVHLHTCIENTHMHAYTRIIFGKIFLENTNSILEYYKHHFLYIKYIHMQ